MSSRWSYGPEGLRERPTKRWSDAVPLPQWRELQPLLIRSAGVVGIVATIMAVLSSDALRFGALPGDGRAETALASPADASTAPAIIAVPSAPGADAAASAASNFQETNEGGGGEPPAAAGVAGASASEAVADLRRGQAPPAPARLAMVSAATEAPAAPQPRSLEDLRTEEAAWRAAPVPVAPLTTASVPATDRSPAGGSARAIEGASAAELPRPADAVTASPGASVWPQDAAACPRDWVAAEAGHGGPGGGCRQTADLIASVEEADQNALQDAAAARAEALGALAPRVPVPRPENVPDAKPVRVSRASSNWPPGPPPNCGAGHSAKWHFVDRKAGTKAWYCR